MKTFNFYVSFLMLKFQILIQIKKVVEHIVELSFIRYAMTIMWYDCWAVTVCFSYWLFASHTHLLHKSHKAPIPYPTMQYFVTEMCTCVHISVKNGALWDICLLYCGICEMSGFNPRNWDTFNFSKVLTKLNLWLTCECKIWDVFVSSNPA